MMSLQQQQPDVLCTEPTPSIIEQQLMQELRSIGDKLHLKQQEVHVLQAQVERLSSFLDDEGRKVDKGRDESSSLQQQLDAALSELQHTRDLLGQLTQEGKAATAAACEQRFGALKVLLAQQITELWEAEAQRAAAVQLAADKTEDCEAMRTALAAANAHIFAVSAKQQELQQSFSALCAQKQEPATLQQQVQVDLQTAAAHLPPASDNNLAADSTSSCSTQPAPPGPSCNPQDGAAAAAVVVEQLQQQLRAQQQQMEVAQQQVKELVHHLALKHDCCRFAERRADMMQQQLEAAQQQLQQRQRHKHVAAAAEPGKEGTLQQHRRSCTHTVEDGEEEEDATDATCLTADVDPPGKQPQQQHQVQHTDHHKQSLGLAGSLSAAISNAASGFSLTGPKSDDQEVVQQQPQRQQTSPPLSPFVLARNFVAGRETEALVRLKEELREREQQVSSLTADSSCLEVQLEGLQTILVTKVSQCNRLGKELKEAHRELKQAEAAAAADQLALGQQLEQLRENVVQLEDALAASQEREQQAAMQLAATRAKLAQVLQALVEDAAALQQHQPAEYKHLADDMPAALASVLAAATAAASGTTQAAAAAACTASPSADGSSSQPINSQKSRREMAGALEPPSTAISGAAAASEQRFILRSLMRSRTVSSHDGGAVGSGGVAIKAGGGSGSSPEVSWGRCVSASVHVQPQKLGWTGGSSAVRGGTAGSSTAAAPKQSAAAKLLEAFKLVKKGKEAEAGEDAVAVAAAAARQSSSSDYSYELLDS